MKRFGLLAIFVAFAVVSCKKDDAEMKPADVDHYTCTMHPSVKSQDPHGKCPICGMDLVPVKKKSASDQATKEAITNHDSDQPSDFTVPIERQQQIGVTFGKVDTRPFHHTIRTVGTVAYDMQRQWDYVTRVDGYVQKLNVFSPGESVEKGAPLLTIYSPELNTTQVEFVNALTMRDNTHAKSSAESLKTADDLVESGKVRLRLWNITDDQIAELEKTRKPQETIALRSPFKGLVRELAVDQGQHVGVGEKLIEVADLSVVWVWAQFFQDDLPMLKNGLPVTITMPSYPGEKFNGKIAVIDPSLNAALRTTRVRIDVDNAELKLRPDMYVDVNLSMDMGSGLTVPVGAILPTGLHNIAFVDKGDGRLEPRYVELGREYGDVYEVKSGLKESERVVTSANFLIDAEAKVQGALKEW